MSPTSQPQSAVTAAINKGVHIRPGTPADESALLALLPRLAEFELSPRRNSTDLWHSDAALVVEHLTGDAPQCLLLVAEDTLVQPSAVVGLALVSMQGEFMSHEPGSHLEAIAVAKGTEGRGVGRALLEAAELGARERGAQSMTLHVFNANERAHQLYESIGFESEMQRCIKWFEPIRPAD